MNGRRLMDLKVTIEVALVSLAFGWGCGFAGRVCQAQTPPPHPRPDLQEVIKLAHAQITDTVIVSYINNTGRSFQLSADEIIDLRNQGVSQDVINALLQAKGILPPANPMAAPAPAQAAATAPAAATQPAGAAAPKINFQYFHDQLAPFGTWMMVAGKMYWRPDAALAANPNWRPYYDMGRWVLTENGLYWQSDYTWGDIPFHYGRWILDPAWGWLWSPDYVWGPAWVFWRYYEPEASIGWAPLPVGAEFGDGGFTYFGVVVAADYTFNLNENCFVFVNREHFHDGFFRLKGREYDFHEPRERVKELFAKSVVKNDFRKDVQGRLVNNGIGQDHVEHLTHVEHAPFEERHPVGDRERLNAERAEDLRKQSLVPQPGKPGIPPHAMPEPISKVFRPPVPAGPPAPSLGPGMPPTTPPAMPPATPPNAGKSSSSK